MKRNVLVGMFSLATLTTLAACGNSHDGYAGGLMAPNLTASSPMAASYTVGGQLTGLVTGASITLLDNGGDTLTLTTGGTFTFPTSLASGAAYLVTVSTQPGGENCTVTDGSGTVAAAAITSVMVTCSATPNAAAANISQSNATTVASEAMLALQSFGNVSAASPGASLGATSASSMALMRVVAPRMNAAARGAHPADTTTTNACVVSGSITEDESADGTSSSVTFNACVEAANLTLNGVETFSNLIISVTPALVTLTANVQENLNVTIGAVSEVEAGSFALSGAFTPNTSFVFDLSAVNLTAALSLNGALVDNEALSNASITLTEDLTISPNQLYTDFAFTLASTALNGSITATTTATLKRIADPAVTRIFPYTGQVLITGSNNTRVQITILGDETYSPPAGEGQVEIQVDTGSGTFGSPIWVNWATLSAVTSAATTTYSIGGTLSGLATGATVTLLNEGTDPLTLATNGSFSFLTPLASASPYAVTVGRQPTGQTCSATDASGTVGAANVTSVVVSCQ